MNETARLMDTAAILEGKIPRQSSLGHLKPQDALEEIINTMVDHQTYCKRHEQKFLAYLIEMVILECMDEQSRLDDSRDSGETALS